MMSQEYMRSKGMIENSSTGGALDEPAVGRVSRVEVDGHVLKVRTKTFKMLSEPTISELNAEVELLQKWLPRMVELDNSFDVDLSALDSQQVIQGIEDKLSGKT